MGGLSGHVHLSPFSMVINIINKISIFFLKIKGHTPIAIYRNRPHIIFIPQEANKPYRRIGTIPYRYWDCAGFASKLEIIATHVWEVNTNVRKK